jgi:hypothetical protein
VLSRSTLTPIGNLIFAISASAGATWWAATIASRLERIEAALTEASHSKVSNEAMRLWALRLQRANATITVPEWDGD